jgi:predicted HicB family RNase H-like nuclease
MTDKLLIEYKGFYSTVEFDCENETFVGGSVGIPGYLCVSERKTIGVFCNDFRTSINDYLSDTGNSLPQTTNMTEVKDSVVPIDALESAFALVLAGAAE